MKLCIYIDYHSHKIGAYTINYKNGEDKSLYLINLIF